jgi:hypothetical protein
VRCAVGFTESALIDFDRLPLSCQHSVHNAVARLQDDPSPNSPYRQEFQLTDYDREFVLVGDLRSISWECGNVVVDYVYSAQGHIVVILAVTHVPPKL